MLNIFPLILTRGKANENKNENDGCEQNDTIHMPNPYNDICAIESTLKEFIFEGRNFCGIHFCG